MINLNKILCFFKHNWDYRTRAKDRLVRDFRKCKRCNNIQVLYFAINKKIMTSWCDATILKESVNSFWDKIPVRPVK